MIKYNIGEYRPDVQEGNCPESTESTAYGPSVAADN